MALTSQWRSVLAALLVFAVSPLSTCAQMVCNITCSFHGTMVRDSSLSRPKRNESLPRSVNQSAAMHCHDPANSDGTHPVAFRSHNGACHRDSCVSSEGAAAASVVAQGNWSTAPTDVIAAQLSSAIPLAMPALTGRHRSRNYCVACPDVLAASGTLRI
jgi:hypothetical protein